MPFEQRLQLLIGQQAFQITALMIELEAANARIVELEAAEAASSAVDRNCEDNADDNCGQQRSSADQRAVPAV